VLVCVSLQDNDAFTPSALDKAKATGGLVPMMVQLLSLGADAVLKDKVRACTRIKTWSYTYSMRASLGSVP
jgi:hypothetical protein